MKLVHENGLWFVCRDKRKLACTTDEDKAMKLLKFFEERDD